MIELSRSRKANVFALIAVLGVLGTMLLVWKASEQIYETAGPSALASAGGAVYFAAGDTLYVADADGALRHEIPFESLGLDGVVSHLAVLDEELLVAVGGSGAVQRCNLESRSCKVLIDIPMPGRGGALALAPAPEAGRIYVTDTSSHQLHAYDLDGKHLYRLDIDGGLKYPNEVVWLGDGQLLVADTNHHRIIVVQDEGDGRSRLLQKMAARNDLGRGNTWPIAAARDGDGNTWVINSDGFLNNGELIVYEAAGKARLRIDLGEGADPVVLAPLKGSVLLADYANYRLQRVDIDDYRVEAFGAAALRDALKTLHGRRNHWQEMRYLGVGMVVLFSLLGALAAYLDWKVRRGQTAGQRDPGMGRSGAEVAGPTLAAAARLALSPDAHGVVWLAPSRRMLGWNNAVFALSLLMLVAGSALIFQACEDLPTRLIALLGVIAAMTLGIHGWLIQRMKRLRIGTDGKLLHVVDLFGREGQGVPEAFIHTGRRLYLGRIAVPLPNRHISMFDREAFTAVIEPMLEHTQRSNELAILVRNLRQGDPLTWSGVVAIAAVLTLRVWLDL